MGDLKVNGGGDLDVVLFAFDEPDGFAREFEELDIVGDLVQGKRAGCESVEQVTAAHDLGGLHGPEFAPAEGFDDLGWERAGGLLDGEMNGQRGGGGAVANTGVEDAEDQTL